MNITGKKYSVVITANEVCVSAYEPNHASGTRGIVAGISRGSQSRMRRFLNSLIFDSFSFITLTYRYNQQDWKRAYADLRLWHKNMSRHAGNACVIWKQELQKRGAVHFHLFTIDPPQAWTQEVITDEWMDTTRQTGDTAARKYGVVAKTYDLIENSGAGIICAYMAKYAQKDSSATCGRAWGCLGRRYARAQEERTEVSELQASAVFELLRQSGFRENTVDGGTVYSRVYCGHIGRGDGSRLGDDIKRTVQAICGVV